MFRPSLSDFDVVIRLHTNELSRGREAVDAAAAGRKRKHQEEEEEEEEEGKKKETMMPVVEFDAAALYLTELKVRVDGCRLKKYLLLVFSLSIICLKN